MTEQRAGAQTRTTRFLLVEDDAADAELTIRTLRSALSADVEVVHTRAAFLAALCEHPPDIVLADYAVPGFSGPQALRDTLDSGHGCPFIYVSGTIGEERAVEALRDGATDYVLKDNANRLVPVVQRALREVEQRRERELAERALRDSEARIWRIVDNADDVIFGFRVGRRPGFEYLSPSVERVLGITREDLLAREDFGLSLVHPDDVANLAGGHRATNRMAEVRVRRPDGSYAWLEIRSVPVTGRGGELVALEGIARDVTERKAAEARVHRHSVLQSAVADLGAFALARRVDHTISLAVKLLHERLAADMVGVFRAEGERRVLASGAGWRTPDPSFDFDRTISAETRLILFDDAAQRPADSTVAQLVRAEGGVSAGIARLIADGEILGVLIVAWRGPRTVDTDEQSFIEMTANVLANTMSRSAADRQLRQTVADLRAVDQQRRRLLARLVSAQEEERRRIAADVHDDSIQIMTAAALRLEMFRDNVPTDGHEEFDRLTDVVRRSIERLRRLMFALRPPQLDREGLSAALSLYVEATADDGGPSYKLVDELVDEPPEDLRALLYRIAQEALTNVRKHAQAEQVVLTLFQRDGGVGVRVEDDGVGFSQGTLPPDHLGLVAMRERAELAGGLFSVEPRDGGGTVVDAWVPLSTPGVAALRR